MLVRVKLLVLGRVRLAALRPHLHARDCRAHRVAHSVAHRVAHSVAHSVANGVAHSVANGIAHSVAHSVANGIANGVAHAGTHPSAHRCADGSPYPGPNTRSVRVQWALRRCFQRRRLQPQQWRGGMRV